VGNLVFHTQDRMELGPLIEEVVRGDVGAATPLPYDFMDEPDVAAGAEGTPVDLRQLIGLGWTTVGTIRVRLPWPRDATLSGHLVRFGLVTYVGSVRYSIELDRDLDAEVRFEREKGGGPTFVGGAAASRLNAVPDLAKRVSGTLREEFFTGSLWVKGEGCGMTVVRSERGSILGLWTYSRLTGVLGRNATTDAGDVLEIANTIQATI
jgi:hypothetical protein